MSATASRRLVSAAAIGVFLVVALLFTTPPARPSTQTGLTVGLNKRVTQSYSGVVGSFPPTPSPGPEPDPATCDTAPQCDTIPLTVEQPANYTVFDQFVLEVELSWPTSAAPQDLNLYLWYDPQTGNAASVAATSNNPEKVRFSEPRSGKYFIVVANAGGANLGYTITARSSYVQGTRPAELDASPNFTAAGAGSAGSSGSSGTGTGSGTNANASSSARPSPVPAVSTPLILPSGEVPAAAAGAGAASAGAFAATDPSLSAIAPDASALGATSGGGQLFRTSAENGPPRPISPPLLILWTVIAPLALAAAAALTFLRLRPSALTIQPKPTVH
jgi:hypothetical protein